jgi:hypothetical protein
MKPECVELIKKTLVRAEKLKQKNLPCLFQAMQLTVSGGVTLGPGVIGLPG